MINFKKIAKKTDEELQEERKKSIKKDKILKRKDYGVLL